MRSRKASISPSSSSDFLNSLRESKSSKPWSKFFSGTTSGLADQAAVVAPSSCSASASVTRPCAR
jgi:hypothetical protein